jgi:hypothetical protein
MRGKKISVTVGEPLQGVSKRDITDRLQRKLVWLDELAKTVQAGIA